MVELSGIGCTLGGRVILADVSLRFEPGAFTVLLGPNGAGKTTLLRIAAGLLSATRGTVTYPGGPIGALEPRALARIRAVLSQHAEPAFPLSAGEVVEMGRYPHHERVPGRRDLEAVERALETVGMQERRAQPFSTLSAGERQAVQMARVLAQIDADGDAPGRVLFLDEPTSNLDVRHQLQLLGIARALTARGVTVIAVLHDLNHAFEFADQLVLLEAGRVVHAGPRLPGPTATQIEKAYQVRAWRVPDAADGRELWRFGL